MVSSSTSTKVAKKMFYYREYILSPDWAVSFVATQKWYGLLYNKQFSNNKYSVSLVFTLGLWSVVEI
jgi:hypothetical protein